MSDLQMTFHGGVRPACGGPWHLTAGRTVLVRPRQASTLRVVCGRVWATTDAPLDLSARRLGDHVLGADESLVVLPGERLVVEAWSDASLRFDLLPQAEVLSMQALRWHTAVATPACELGRALGAAAVALGRLGAGVAAYAAYLAGWLVSGRGRLLSHFESNPP